MKPLFLTFCCLARTLCAQVPYFNIQFDYNHHLEAAMRGSVETDSFYLFPIKGGSSYPGIADTSFLLKVNKFNADIGYAKISYFEGQSAISVLKKANRDVYVQGSNYHAPKESNNADNSQYVALLDRNTLDTLALKQFGLPGRIAVFYRPLIAANGSIFSSGWSFPAQSSARQSLLVFKCDSNLNQRFFKLLPPNPATNHYGGGAVETPDGGFLIVGARQVGNPVEYNNALIVKVDSSGNQVFWKEIPHTGDTTELYLSDVARNRDGTYVAVGRRIYNPQVGPGWERSWAVGLDGQGKILWSKSYAENERSDWANIAPSSDGNFYACGYERDFADVPPYRQYATISKLSPTGALIWHRRHALAPAGKHCDQFFHVMATSDGGILCSGASCGNDITLQNAWVVKLDSLGCSRPGCDTGTGVLELPLENAAPFVVAPNPTSGMFQIQPKNNLKIDAVRVFAKSGAVIYRDSNLAESPKTIDLGNQQSGSYFCAVLADGSWHIRQIILIR